MSDRKLSHEETRTVLRSLNLPTERDLDAVLATPLACAIRFDRPATDEEIAKMKSAGWQYDSYLAMGTRAPRVQARSLKEIFEAPIPQMQQQRDGNDRGGHDR